MTPAGRESGRPTGRARFAAVALAALAFACGASASAPTPGPGTPAPPTEVAGASRGASEGRTDIRLTGADPLPGATIAGCGAGASGCGGRVRLRLRLLSAAGGTSLGLVGFLHSDRATACFRTILPAFVLSGGEAREFELAFDPMDTDEACPTPLHVTHLAVVVEGTEALFARQEWGLRYEFVRSAP